MTTCEKENLFLRVRLLLTGLILLTFGSSGFGEPPPTFGESTGILGTNNPGSSELVNQTSNRWSIDVVPYLWLVGYEADVSIPAPTLSLPAVNSTSSGAPYQHHLSAAAMLAMQVHYREFGLLLDGAWVQVETEGEVTAGGLISAANLTTDIAYGTAALSYTLPAWQKLHSEVFGGARVWNLSMAVDYQSAIAGEASGSNTRTWADPIIGALLRYDLTGHWFATVWSDIGGFGAGSRLTYSVFGGFGYRFCNWFSATLGYRYLHVDYDQDGFVFNADIQGFLLGVGFHF